MGTDPFIIAISGKSGCGNSTISTLLAKRLGIRLINFTFRNLAEERGISLAEVLDLARKDFSWDREVDDRQVRMAREEDCVIGSRLAVWLLPEASLSVYLHASGETRARRIMNREGGKLEEVLAFTQGRDAQDTARYKELYHIDNNEHDFVDLAINTERLGPDEIVDIIEAAAKAIKSGTRSGQEDNQRSTR